MWALHEHCLPNLRVSNPFTKNQRICGPGQRRDPCWFVSLFCRAEDLLQLFISPVRGQCVGPRQRGDL